MLRSNSSALIASLTMCPTFRKSQCTSLTDYETVVHVEANRLAEAGACTELLGVSVWFRGNGTQHAEVQAAQIAVCKETLSVQPVPAW